MNNVREHSRARATGRAADESSASSEESDSNDEDGVRFDCTTPTRSASSAMLRTDGVWNVAEVGTEGKVWSYTACTNGVRCC